MKQAASLARWALLLLAIILIFAGIDFLFHSLSPRWAVPDYYFRNKIIFGWLLSIPAFIIARRFARVWQQAFFFSISIATLLQIRYYLEGYPKSFVFIFLGIHFLILFLLSFATFQWANKNKYI